MKNITYTLFFLLFSASVFQANSQTAMLSPENSNEQKIAHIKTFKSKYIEGKVYMHIIVNGNTETKTLVIERSLDAINFEVIGYINVIGTNAQIDIAYYFKDESPVIANLYYRLSDYSFNNQPIYSEIISVVPVDENKITTPITPISNEQTNFLSLGSNFAN